MENDGNNNVQEWKTDTSEYRFTWIIRKFSKYQHEAGKYITSNCFILGSPPELHWYIKLYPNGDDEGNDGWISVYLICQEEVVASCNISLVDQNDQEYNKRCVFDEFNNEGEGFERFIERKCVRKCNDSLIILCEVELAEEFQSKNYTMSELIQERQLSDDLKSLYVSGKYADFKLIAKSTEVRVHRAILAARSPVFAAMLSHDVVETQTGSLEIQDIEPNTMVELINYLYTGHCSDRHEHSESLLIASDKYDIKGLKLLCERRLAAQISTSNALTILHLGDRYNAQILKSSSIDFISQNLDQVEVTEGWKSLIMEHPQLLVEVQTAIIKKKQAIINERPQKLINKF